MTVFDIKIEGVALLEKKLLALERKIGRKIVRKAVRAGAKPMLAATKANANSMVGGEMGNLIARNLQPRAFKKQRRGQYGVATRLKTDVPEFIEESKAGRRNYIPSAIEFGHIDRAGGFVPAIPYIRVSFDSTKRTSEKAVALTFKTEIEATAKRG